tara:strand:- start:1486 stop:1707 length:222 start_codon:yes stop_codon:yes gene_type:complete
MKIIQNKKTGSAKIEFTKQEIKILNKKGFFYLPAKAMKHLTNTFAMMAADFNENFNKKEKDLMTHYDEELKVK